MPGPFSVQLATAPTILPPVYTKRSLLYRFLFFLFLRCHTPFLSLPYAGVYTLLDNRVQGCLGLLLCSWQPHQPSSLKSHPTFGAELKILPAFGEACVCNPWNHRDPFGFFWFVYVTAGGSWTHGWHEPTKTHPCRRDTRPDQSGVPAIFLPF